ncbi:hypothetical protein L3Q72_07570 [Vibrio sp. JC009]|uniref:hypothetical protein n=1 Tax=Vibrio sp. JC009 TaxID=2912314 RepID=UPI0023AECF57|nr:hypothetical protein [Vibrio sp. JC009]WED23240.1 hypothetical protein L3Q72_07570 [Vibrio sp. JC009]
MDSKLLGAVLTVIFLGGCYDQLPPDPGKEGMLTLEGIDSDEDGVRDDVQRYIGENYYLDKELHTALTGLAIAYQDTILQHTSKEETFKQWSETTRALHCLYLADPEGAYSKQQELKSVTLNTRARIEAHFEAQKHLSGRTLTVPSSKYDEEICNGTMQASVVKELP